jgi:RNA polymerase sigma-70 factor (ECF subfamily)
MTATDLQATFVERLERNRAILFNVANAYCRRPADREDLIAETVAQLWKSYGRFDERVAFTTWMYRIAVNVAVSFYRSESRRRRATAPGGDAFVDTIPAPQDVDEDDRLAILRAFVERLDGLDRALMLLYLDDRPYAEIAAILGISETNVGTKVGRIKERLRRSIATTTPENGGPDGTR